MHPRVHVDRVMQFAEEGALQSALDGGEDSEGTTRVSLYGVVVREGALCIGDLLSRSPIHNASTIHNSRFYYSIAEVIHRLNSNMNRFCFDSRR